MSNFNFTEAQKYELDWQREYIEKAFPAEYAEWEKRKEQKMSVYPQHFFEKGESLAEYYQRVGDFLIHIEGKRALEIGCGSIPLLKEAWDIQDRIVIDPLADEYQKIEMELFGKTFFDGLVWYSQSAETIIDPLVNSVDGFILCRNALDHMEDPLWALRVMSVYAKSGCYFLFWTDIWHYDGGNEGHRNITKSTRVMDAILDGLGFDKICTAPQVRTHPIYIEYGGVFRKR